MAAPEIELPRRLSEEDNYDTNGDVTKHDVEKHPSSPSLSSHSNCDGEIVWHYLTFDTELPSPAYLSHDLHQQEKNATLSECPNLKKYESPFLWSEGRKSTMTWLSCIATMFTAFNAGSYSSGIGQMMDEWHVSRVALLVGIATFTCGFGIAPMFLAPFSEINGRRPVFIATGLLWVLFQIVCAVTPTFAGMLINRFFSGCASSTFSTMVGGVISDIYHAKDRNTAMSLFSAFAVAGTGLGPLVSGFIAQNTTWRWIFYLQIIVDGTLMLFVLFLFKETRGSVLLSRKAQVLNKWYTQIECQGYFGMLMPSPTDPSTKLAQRIRWKCKADEERSSIMTMIKISLWRPFHMLLTEPVVFFFSLWVSFAWSILFMTFSAVPLIFQTTYAFTLQESGAVFSASVIACFLFCFVAIYQDRLALHYLPAHRTRILHTPEGRLVFACFESVLLPVGCLWFCVAGAYPGVPWIVPTLGLGVSTMGIFSIYLAVFNYLADAYHRYASSALAAQSFCRNMMGGAFPIFTNQMFNTMTFQGAGGFLGGLGFLLTAVPWVLLLYGPQIRAKSKLAREILVKE